MGITWTKVHEVTSFLYDGCGPQGITCMGDGRMLAVLEEVINVGDISGVYRFFRSEDNGATWAALTPIVSITNITFNSHLRATGLNTVLVPDTLNGVLTTYEQWSYVGRTTDGGDTWASAVSASDYATLQATYGTFYLLTDTIVSDTGNRVLAIGQLDAGLGGAGTHASYLTSNDGGVSFGTTATGLPGSALTLTANTGAYLGNQIMLVCVTDTTVIAGNSCGVRRSTDNGTNWSTVSVPSGGGLTTITHADACCVGPLGSMNAVLVGKSNHATSRARVWNSSDAGATWTLGTISTPGGTGTIGARSVISPSATYVIAGVQVTVANRTGGSRPFVMSTDGGLTFTDLGTYASAFTASEMLPLQFAMADDGAILAWVETGAGGTIAEIWRGVIDDFSGPGPCAAFVPPPPPPPPPPVPVPAITQGSAGHFPTRIVAVYRP